MKTIRKVTLLCGMAALLAVSVLSPVARADELRHQDKTIFEGNKGGRGHGRGGRGGRGHGGGGRHRGGSGSGWAWAGLGAAVGLGILSAINDNDSKSYTYVESAPSYQVVHPGTTYYYYPEEAYPTTTYVQPNYGQPVYVQPNYGQTYVTPVQPAAPAPCTVCP